MKKPNVINFHITDACNYSCRYCFANFKMQDLPLADAKRVVDSIVTYFRENGIADGRINIAGGEPLLYRRLDAVIDYIVEKGVKVSIITNGSRLTEERIAAWSDKVSMIGISVDAITPAAEVRIGRCDGCEQVNTVEHLTKMASAIRKAGIRLKINTVVSKINLDEDMLSLYRAVKPDRLKLIYLHVVRYANEWPDTMDLIPTLGEYHAFIEKNRYEDECELVCEGPTDMENSYFMINPHGEVYINCLGIEKKYGNCIYEPLSQIFERLPFDAKKFSLRYEEEV
ncbi:MAG: viperin family antiviral radical SAM protein [Clostridia bacterium]|nr:viperin family antiviral radical SAM protein [Clostridia bacterium]